MSTVSLHQNYQLPLDHSAELETGHYLNPQKWGWFSVLQRTTGERQSRQKSYRLRELPFVLQSLQSTSQRNRDSWITQAVFKEANRRKMNLAHVGTCFVDLDYYNSDFKFCEPAEVLEQVLIHCEAMAIPFPSLAIDSGRGLQLKWYHTPLPRQALPRWDAVQSHLCMAFANLGADKYAKDASRVLRVVRTVNQKNGKPVQVIWQQSEGFTGEAKHYDFEELAAAILPVSRTDLTAKKKTRKGKKAEVIKITGRSQFSLNSLNWSRMEDILTLGKIRGGFGEGEREQACFWACNFYALRYAKELAAKQLNLTGEYHEFASICRQIAPHWDMAKIRDKTGNLYPLLSKHAKGETVEFHGQQYSPLYTPKSQYLIDQFSITDDEQRQLLTIHSAALHEERDRERKRKERNGGSMNEYNDKRQQNKREILRLFSCGLRQVDIAKATGLSKGLVSRFISEHKKRLKAAGGKG